MSPIQTAPPRRTGITIHPDVSRRLDVVAAAMGVNKSEAADLAFRSWLESQEKELGLLISSGSNSNDVNTN